MGGLTVFNAVADNIPGENIVYFGDTAHLPYGSKSKETVIEYAKKALIFFTRCKVKCMVVACNTASVYALDTIKEYAAFPIIGVVQPGVNAASRTNAKSIGIIGTYGTIKSMTYQQKLKQKNSEIKLLAKSCPLFVPLVEEGWIEHEVTRKVARIYLDTLKNKIQVLILGCTHYPLLKNIISDTVGKKVKVIDSAQAVSKKVKRILQNYSLLNPQPEKTVNYRFYVSDAPELFAERGSIFLDKSIENVQKIEVV